jgi:hypothetical protein
MSREKTTGYGFFVKPFEGEPDVPCFSAETELGEGRISFVQGQTFTHTENGEQWTEGQ